MFDSFRDKLRSVVQDGIHLNKTVREKISQIQRNSVRTLKTNSLSEDIINHAAGSTILDKYQKEWREIHAMSEECAMQAEKIDFYMTTVHIGISKRLEDISQINSALSSLPKIINNVEDCVNRLKSLNNMYEEVENDITNLEIIIDRCDFEQRKVEHIFQLSMYKEKKLVELENSRVNLAVKQTELLRETEKKHRDMLKERQMAASLAFQEDLTLYKTQGELPKIILPNNGKSNELTLEEIELSTEDTAELDKFLSDDKN